MVNTTWPSSPMRTRALGVTDARAAWLPNGRLRLSIRPPPAAVPECRTLRRERVVMSASLGLGLRGVLDRITYAAIGSAAADVAGHRRVDVGVGRLGSLRQQRSGRHDLPGLAVAALHDLLVE